MKTCLVFGGNGFLGSHLAEELVNKGYNVKVFDNFQNGINNLKAVADKIEIIKGNFLNDVDVSSALKNTDYVFHYISTTNPATAGKDPIFEIESNIVGSIKLFQNAIKTNVKKIIFASSGGTIYGEPTSLPISETDYPNPIEPYGISKLAIEKYLYYYFYTHGLDYIILRYSNPYGERQNPYSQQGVIPIFLNKIREGGIPTVFGDGSIVRDYIYIEDAIHATIAVFENDTNEKIFNIGSGSGRSLNELIKVISRIVGKEIVPNYVKTDRYYIQKIILDISRIQNEVGWTPNTDLEAGVNKTWQWINSI